MPIVPFASAHLPRLYDVYRQMMAGVPHCQFTPSLSYTGHTIAQAEQAGARLLVAEDQVYDSL